MIAAALSVLGNCRQRRGSVRRLPWPALHTLVPKNGDSSSDAFYCASLVPAVPLLKIGAVFSDDGSTLITIHVPVLWGLPGPKAIGGGSFGMWDVRLATCISQPVNLVTQVLNAPN